MKLIVGTLLILLSFFSCSKQNTETTNLQILLTDAPLAVDEVNIDLREVRVKYDKDTAAWHTLQTTSGVYNLLALQNGVTTMIASGNVATTQQVKELRLILGTNNTVVENGQSYALTIPGGAESGLKIKIGKKLRGSIDTIVIDFDAALSVKKEGDGYKLRPVLKLK